MNIVLVDDDIDDVLLFRQAIKDINGRIGCVEFESGADLLNYLYVASNYPTVIFLDFNMPGMNGYECLVEIRDKKEYNSIPVVIYTTYLSPDQEQKCTRLGASVILKPNTYSELMEVIETKILEIAVPLN